MLKKNFFRIVVFLLLGLPCLTLQAAEIKDFKIAILDTDRLLQESKASIKAREYIEKQRDQFQKELTAQEALLRQESEKLNDLEKKNDPAFTNKRAEFDEKVSKAHEKVAMRRKQLENIYQESQAQIIKMVMELASDYQKKNGLMLILPRSMVVIFEPGLDITEEILKQLNQRLPEVRLSKPSES